MRRSFLVLLAELYCKWCAIYYDVDIRRDNYFGGLQNNCHILPYWQTCVYFMTSMGNSMYGADAGEVT